jgi:hypothetical protein
MSAAASQESAMTPDTALMAVRSSALFGGTFIDLLDPDKARKCQWHFKGQRLNFPCATACLALSSSVACIARVLIAKNVDHRVRGINASAMAIRALSVAD